MIPRLQSCNEQFSVNEQIRAAETKAGGIYKGSRGTQDIQSVQETGEPSKENDYLCAQEIGGLSTEIEIKDYQCAPETASKEKGQGT